MPRYHVNMIDVNNKNPETPPIERLYQAYRACTSRPDAILVELGLGRAHHRLLYFVGRYPGLAVSALLDRLKVSKQAAHGPLRELIERGLVTATPAPHDRRVRELTLTEAGRALEARLTGLQSDHLQAACALAGPEAAAGWLRVLDAIAALD